MIRWPTGSRSTHLQEVSASVLTDVDRLTNRALLYFRTASSLVFGTKEYDMLCPLVPASRSTRTSDSPTDCADHRLGPPPTASTGWSTDNLHIWDSSRAQNLLRCAVTRNMHESTRREKKQGTTMENPGLPLPSDCGVCSVFFCSVFYQRRRP